MKKQLQLPDLKGTYQVGITLSSFIDENRNDKESINEKKKREIPIIIWYPIDSAPLGETRLYVTTESQQMLKKHPLYKAIAKNAGVVYTNSYENMPISTKASSFPVILFSHGYSGIMEQNTILMEFLASHGFITISIGHPNDGFVSYPNRETRGINMETFQQLQKETRKHRNQLKAAKKKLQSKNLTTAELEKYTKLFLEPITLLNTNIEIWIKDVQFILENLQLLNSGIVKSQFKRKLALETGVGAFGHSFGGVTSILTACIDKRIVCAANLDGGMYGAFNQEYVYNKPFLFIESEQSRGMSQYFYNKSKVDAQMMFIKKTKHLDFTDFPFIYRSFFFKLLGFFGKIDPKLMVEILSHHLLQFFNKYLKKEEPVFEKVNLYPEVFLQKK